VIPCSDETRDQIVTEYNECLAPQVDRYKITKRQLYEAMPYY